MLGQERLVEHLVLRPADRAQHGGRPELAGGRQVLLGQDPLHQLLLVVGVVDHEPAVEPDRLAVAAQHPGAQRVERAGFHVLADLTGQGGDPLAQLARGAVGEGDGEDAPWPDRLDPDQVRDPVGDDPGLAAAGTGEDEQRALGRGDRPGLLGIEVRHDLVGPGRAPGGDGGRDRLRVERWARPGDVGSGGRVTQPVGLLDRRWRRGGVELEPRALGVGLDEARTTALRGLVGPGGAHPPILGCRAWLALALDRAAPGVAPWRHRWTNSRSARGSARSGMTRIPGVHHRVRGAVPTRWSRPASAHDGVPTLVVPPWRQPRQNRTSPGRGPGLVSWEGWRTRSPCLRRDRGRRRRRPSPWPAGRSRASPS